MNVNGGGWVLVENDIKYEKSVYLMINNRLKIIMNNMCSVIIKFYKNLYDNHYKIIGTTEWICSINLI